MKPAFDYQDLLFSTRHLLGYFVHTWFAKYLEIIKDNLSRFIERGQIADLFTPTQHGRRVLFDFLCINDANLEAPQVLHLERLAYLVGIYLHILTRHKAANFELMQRSQARRVLYLRGYDFVSAARVAGPVAAGSYTSDTQLFTDSLDLGDGVSIFMIMSPQDIYWETIHTQQFFYGDFDRLVKSIASIRRRAFYFHASDWKVQVKALLDRMDHYIVYVSSITESVLWEIAQLDTPARRDRTTIVFDERAINAKEFKLHLQASMERGHEPLWATRSSQSRLNVDRLRKKLAAKFLVTTPEAFLADIAHHNDRIAASKSKLPPGKRERWFDFHFAPVASSKVLAGLGALSKAAEGFAHKECVSGIECLPLLVTHTQLRIFMTLLMGAHDDCGRALARYQAIMEGAIDYFEPPGSRVAALSPERKERHLSILRNHRTFAESASFALFSFGPSHDFSDRTSAAKAELASVREQTKRAVDRFFSLRGGPLPT